jgi:hypothetical protein
VKTGVGFSGTVCKSEDFDLVRYFWGDEVMNFREEKVEALTIATLSDMPILLRRVVGILSQVVRRRIARREGLFRRFVDEGVLVSAKDFLFGSQPVVEFQARLPASPQVEFVGPSSDLFFE